MVLIRTRTGGARHAEARLGENTAPANDGYGPASLQSAYKLPSSTAGSSQTVAVVNAFNDPSAAADLATYRSSWGLPACGTGCFTKVNQNGLASPLPRAAGNSGWATEESLDIEMVSPSARTVTSSWSRPATTHIRAVFDVTSGTDGSCAGSYLCAAGTGYDGPTGLGTPGWHGRLRQRRPGDRLHGGSAAAQPGFERRRISPWKAGSSVLNKAT